MLSHFTPSVKTAKLVGNPVPKESLMSDFLTDIKTLRKRAREHIEQGPITDAYTADRERVLVNLLKKPGS